VQGELGGEGGATPVQHATDGWPDPVEHQFVALRETLRCLHELDDRGDIGEAQRLHVHLDLVGLAGRAQGPVQLAVMVPGQLADDIGRVAGADPAAGDLPITVTSGNGQARGPNSL